ncbi:PrgI family mobile element protein [Pseudonocardia sp. MH-G8]|uniref:PrgI family mobile element protein n=1 Tax=Pseudonocardia sp. MH-G8 TaxID=1854588 RepID=UPI000BA0DD0A|nr:PrgI family protein [Pseudonocardia sp. MH-G8]OZM76571.1 PrgI family protein [Pseudonocardia sp. MH-G8]
MTSPVRIPADVDMADRVIGSFTARQVTILGLTGLGLYLAWDAARFAVPTAVFLALAVPIAVAAVILALGRRDGVSMDRLFVAAIRHRLAPRTRTAHPAGDGPGGSHGGRAPAWLDARGRPAEEPAARGRRGVLRLPARSVDAGNSGTDVGVVDLGTDGLATVAVASTVNFALRTPAEQQALVATFGRYLHSLSAPVQVLVRAQPLDLTGQVADLRARAGELPHPALRAAALEHADYLTRLGGHAVLLRRQVLLVLREPLGPAEPVDGLGGPSPLAAARAGLASLTGTRRPARPHRPGSGGARRAAEARLVRRLGEAMELLAPAGITVTPLDAARTTAVLAATCNPDPLLPPTPRRAGADEVVHAAHGPTYWEGDDPDDDYDAPGHDADQDYDAWDDEPPAPGDGDGWEYEDRGDDEDDLGWDGRAVGPPEARDGRAWRTAPEPGALDWDRSRRRHTPRARGGRR